MAENKRPLITVDNSPKHINLATIKKKRIIGKPMTSNNTSGGVDADRLSVLVDTTRMQLISPPPEEMLRPVNPSSHGTTTAAKRKRTQPATTFSTPLYSRDVNSTSHDSDLGIQSSQPMEATPNPKPRKQGRLHSRQPSLESPTGTSFGHLGSSPVSNDDTSKQHTPSRSKTKTVLVKSPHAKNPDADFIDDVPALVLPAIRRNLLGARSSRRSATPIPPYEPPTDVFTPPREVFLNPVTKSMSKSSKRKTIASASGFKSAKGKKKGSTLSIVTAVKQELPDIDLSLPMPPPSPTDDPLLLSGPPEPDFFPEPTPPRRREMSVQVQTVDGDLPPSSPEPPIAMDEEEAVGAFDWDRNKNIAPEISTDESFMQLDPDDAGVSPVRLFDIAPGSNGGWSDSEDEGEQAGGMEGGYEGEGEYTGRWKTMLVRTKQDPPSSATRGRMEEWGRPISPFPKKVAKLAFLDEEEGEEGEQELNHQQGGQQEEEFVGRKEEEPEDEDRRMSVQILENEKDQGIGQLSVELEPWESNEEEAEEQEVRRMSVEPEQLLELNEEEAEEQEVRRMSVEPEQLLELNEEEEAEEQEVRRMSVEPEQLLDNEEEEEEEQEVRQISVELDDDEELASPFDNLDRLPLQYTEENLPCGNQAVSCVPCRSEQEEDDDQISDDSGELSHDIVKITSDDPRAAARAAAILKQHDYDCYTNIEIKRRHLEAKHRRKSDIEDSAKESRRRDVFSSGVTKVSNSRRRRRSTMGVIGDRVFIPGSPAITLPELLQVAELEVRDSPRSLSQRSLFLPAREDPFHTPIAAKYRVQMADQKVEVYGGDIGEREWTKEDWKHLDACFTDQRLEVGSRLAGAEQNMLASVDMVSIDDVVDKFVISKGGFETITRFGVLWSRENLLERTRALQKKQRSGRIARPTTPYTPLSVSSNILGDKDSRAPSMQIPDFTPLGRRASLPRKDRSTSPQPVPDQNGPTVIPPTLLAPRYSHLLEEAIAISQQGSILSPGQETFPQFEDKDTSDSSDVPSTTIGKRVKGFLFSYLPTLPTSSSTVTKAPISVQPSLPVPPIDILSKPRGPVITPARAPILKPKHPKELVVLHPAPQPPTISFIPRLKKPQRLVELHPPAPLPAIEPAPIPRPRRSSGSSVKDLVRGFEEIQAVSNDKLKRNVGWKTYTDNKRPHWKP